MQEIGYNGNKKTLSGFFIDNVFPKKWPENSFSIAMKFRMLVRMKGGLWLSPHAAPALSDGDVAPVWGVIAWGKPRRRG